jgi:hypothetical protein
MKYKIIGILFILSILFLFSCESTPSSNQSSSKWYKSWVNVQEISDVITLQQGEQPKIIRSNNIEDDIFDFLSDYFIIVGRTAFNGTASEQDNFFNDINKQCRKNGATIALYNISYTDTRSGSFSSGGSYNIRRYDYVVYYFVKSTAPKDKIGLWLVDLSIDERRKYQRNTGTIVNVVYKNSPAFFANILKDDIIIRINDTVINDKDDYLLFYLFSVKEGDNIEVELIRNNRNQVIKFKI